MTESSKINKQGSTQSRKKIYNAIQIAVLGALATGGNAALAQQAPATGDNTVQEVIVTGSRIKRADAETPSPVQIISSEDLKQSGYSSTADILQTLTANGAGTLSAAFPGAFAGSAQGVSLRGLDTSATLVLIDGHRMAPFPLSDDGQRSFVDVGAIPFDSVERIEVLKDGASAAYGSDAMAGVVNVILKKQFTGLTTSIEGGTTTEGGGNMGHASVTYGLGELGSDGWNAYVALEYRYNGRITQSERQGEGRWASLDQTGIGGSNLTPGVINTHNAIPAPDGTNFLTSTTTTARSYYTTSLNGANPGYLGTCTQALGTSAAGCPYINPDAEVQPKTQNINGLIGLSKKLGDDWVATLKISDFNSQGEQYRVSSYANGLQIYPRSYTPLPWIGVGVVPHLINTSISVIGVPVTYPGNTTGAVATVRGVMLDAPPVSDKFDSSSYRAVLELNGTVGGWDTSVSGGWSKVRTNETFSAIVNPYALETALNSTTNPWLVTGGNSLANVQAVFPRTESTYYSSLSFFDANATHSLYKLPGGDLGVSIGAQYIDRFLDAQAPLGCAQGTESCSDAFAYGGQTDGAAYAELSAPILKSLELDAKVRYDHFNGGLSATVPSFGFKYSPLEQIALRGTFGKGFRAPNPAENDQAGQAYSAGTDTDPLLCPGGGTKAGDVLSACHYNLVYLNSANPALKPERSTSETVGLILTPFQAWETTLDYYQIEIKNQIVAGVGNVDDAVRGTPVLSDCLAANGGATTVPCTPAVGPIAAIPVLYVNANSTKVKGFEIGTKYILDTGPVGTFAFGLDWSRIMSYLFTLGGVEYQEAGTHGPSVIGGNTGNPKDRLQGTIGWTLGNWDVKTTLNYVGSFSLTDPSESNGVAQLTCSDGLQNGGYALPWFTATQTLNNNKYCRVQQFLTVDANLQWKATDHLTVHASVLNLFNAQPPLDLNTYGGGNLPYDPSMHQAGAVGRFISAGASYKFW